MFGQAIVAGGLVARNSAVINSTFKTEGYHHSNLVVTGTPEIAVMTTTTYDAVEDDIIDTMVYSE